MITRCILFFSILILCSYLSICQSFDRHINWLKPYTLQSGDGKHLNILTFENGHIDAEKDYTAYYSERFNSNGTSLSFRLTDEVYVPIDANVSLKSDIASEIDIKSEITFNRKESFYQIQFYPFRKNASTRTVEKLVSFKIVVEQQGKLASKNQQGNLLMSYAANSVLATGTWYKIAIISDGIYKLTYNDFLKLGIDPEFINPLNIRIYGNGGGLLPMVNNQYRPDDLQENAIHVEGESDGIFDKNDYVLFYGKGQDKWTLSSADNRFHHQRNFYADTAFYFLNTDLGVGKRIQTQASLPNSNITVNTFDDYQFYELDRFNFIKSGREWFGDPFDISPSQHFNFNFPNIDQSTPVYLKSDFAARTFDQSNGVRFKILYNGTQVQDQKVGAVCAIYTCDYCSTSGSNTVSTLNAAGSDINLTVNFQAFSQPSNGWLNYLELNARRNLVLSGNQMFFRDKNSIGAGNISQFTVSNFTSDNNKIWEVTTPWNVANQTYSYNGNIATFNIGTDSLRQFIAFTGNSFISPILLGAIPNQDLHGFGPADFIIVTHPMFLEQAQQLAEFHRNSDTLRTIVVTTEQVYNEFSSGAQDASAIRNFAKMFFDRATVPGDMPRYLLLFGDGSYDNRNISYNFGNYVVTYQSSNSCSLIGSYTTDDYFGLLDDGEGAWNTVEEIDIGVGRFPVSSVDQAQLVVDKMMNYAAVPGKIIDESSCNSNCSPLGDWRNWLCFVSDDEDGGLHMLQSERLAKPTAKNYPQYNQDKIYLDAFQQVSTSGGQRYPDAKDAFSKRIEKGALLVNYTGHGGELGWTEERILEVADVRSWSNVCRLPLFITATCEFSRYDDPGRTSAGELVLINSAAGGVGLFTTTRLAFSNSNESINRAFLDTLFKTYNGIYPRLGDVFRSAKAAVASDPNNRNVSCLCDPALQLAYPYNKVQATEVNAKPISTATDTLKALSFVTIKGQVNDVYGNKIPNYNGVVYPSVFDKIVKVHTLANDLSSPDTTFELRKSILYKGKAEVKNGDFEFSFIVPKDIIYNYGLGRLSFYVQDGNSDGNGYYDSLMVGGINTNAPADNNGPQVKLFMNNNKFVFGGTTNNEPFIYAEIADSNGINTVGNGIGHDLLAKLDNDNDKTINLNDYYQNDLNSYKAGKVLFQLKDISEGRHTLNLKAWDIYNNSSEAYTEFIVAESAQIALDNLLNYPNPFTTKTRFMFDMNVCCQLLTVEIRIFSVAGKLVKSLNQYITSDGFHVDNIEWDGKDDFGDPIGRGTYIYKVNVKTQEGQTAEKIEKLVILK